MKKKVMTKETLYLELYYKIIKILAKEKIKKQIKDKILFCEDCT